MYVKKHAISLNFKLITKKSKQMMKIVNINIENLHIFLTTWNISVTFLGKMCIMLTLKVTKFQGFKLSLENTVLENHNPSEFSGLKNSDPGICYTLEDTIKACKHNKSKIFSLTLIAKT